MPSRFRSFCRFSTCASTSLFSRASLSTEDAGAAPAGAAPAGARAGVSGRGRGRRFGRGRAGIFLAAKQLRVGAGDVERKAHNLFSRLPVGIDNQKVAGLGCRLLLGGEGAVPIDRVVEYLDDLCSGSAPGISRTSLPTPPLPIASMCSTRGAYRSTDGGKSFDLMPAPHGDHHALWIDPNDPRRLINGNDGGASISLDGGKSWTAPYNQPTAQFYHVAVDDRFPYRVYGAQQDNSTIAIASRDDDGVIGRQDWFEVGGGESGFIAPDPKDSEIIYANAESGQMTRYDHRTNNFRDISVYPLDVSGNGAADLKYRFQWTEPLFVSTHDSNVLYTAAQMVLRSGDQGRTWKSISPDLTRNDKSKQQPSGGPITLDITSVEYYDTVFALAESPRQRGLLWAGSDDGLIHLTRDDGQHWTDVTPKDMPAWSMVSLIDPSPHDVASAYAAIDRHKLDDFKPLIYRTHDSGKTWTRIVTGIPDGAYVHAVREDPVRKGLLYAGTELGVYYSSDDGGHWHPFAAQPAHHARPRSHHQEQRSRGGDAMVVHFGSSMTYHPCVRQRMVFRLETFICFALRRRLKLHYPAQVERRLPVGDNPPAGAVIDYYLKRKPSENEEITLEIFTADAKPVRRLSNHRPKDSTEQPPEWDGSGNSPPTSCPMKRARIASPGIYATMTRNRFQARSIATTVRTGRWLHRGITSFDSPSTA